METINSKEAIYDLERHYSYAQCVYEKGGAAAISKEGAKQRMIVFRFAIDAIKELDKNKSNTNRL